MATQTYIAIIAAGSALTGVVISQVISILLSIFDKRHKKQILLRQKYEQMMFEFQDSLRYVPEVQSCKTLDQLQQLIGPPHIGKAVGLSHLYFPNLVVPLSNYNQSLVAFYNSVLQLYDVNIPATAGAQSITNKEHRKILDNLINDKNIVIDALISNVKKYTKA